MNTTKPRLMLTREMDGHSYEWKDQHGKTLCMGWSRGTKRDAREEANAHLAEVSA